MVVVQLKQFRTEQPTHILNTRTRSQIVEIDVDIFFKYKQKKIKKNCRLFTFENHEELFARSFVKKDNDIY